MALEGDDEVAGGAVAVLGYANADGKVVVFYKCAGKFKMRYEERLTELVTRAAS